MVNECCYCTKFYTVLTSNYTHYKNSAQPLNILVHYQLSSCKHSVAQQKLAACNDCHVVMSNTNHCRLQSKQNGCVVTCFKPT
jgi:hypothetical protein